MSERLQLAEHFIQSHGQNAARALESMPPDIAGGLIDTISDPLSVAALKTMLPYNAAKCILAMSPTSGSKYLASLTVREAAAILRHTDVESRKNLIDLLPRQKAIRVALILGYPQSLVGAWIDPIAMSLPITGNVADARLRIANEGYDHSTIFMVDDTNRIRGSVSLVQLLLQAQDEVSLSALSQNVPGTLRASMTLENAFDSKGWSEADLLPVTDREDRFIGVLRYADLRRALTKPSIAVRAAEGGDNLLGITEACYLGLADLMATTLADNRDGTTAV
jgi:Mg/Co/Ni transporter MgtE